MRQERAEQVASSSAGLKDSVKHMGDIAGNRVKEDVDGRDEVHTSDENSDKLTATYIGIQTDDFGDFFGVKAEELRAATLDTLQEKEVCHPVTGEQQDRVFIEGPYALTNFINEQNRPQEKPNAIAAIQFARRTTNVKLCSSNLLLLTQSYRP